MAAVMPRLTVSRSLRSSSTSAADDGSHLERALHQLRMRAAVERPAGQQLGDLVETGRELEGRRVEEHVLLLHAHGQRISLPKACSDALVIGGVLRRAQAPQPIVRSVTAVDLRPGVIRYESALWETTALALHAEGEAVLVDPCISASEIAAIAADVAERGPDSAWAPDHALATGIMSAGSRPSRACPAIMSRGAAARIASGQAAESVVREGAAEGLSWDGAPRADLVFDPGEALQVGPFTVETMALPGHTGCGAGYRLRALDLLCVGDYLSAIEFPFVYVSTAAYRATLAALSDCLRARSRRTRGTGPRAATGTARGGADRRRGSRLPVRAQASRARRAGGRRRARQAAIAAGAAVQVPRAAGDDDGRLRQDNAEQQLNELTPAA